MFLRTVPLTAFVVVSLHAFAADPADPGRSPQNEGGLRVVEIDPLAMIESLDESERRKILESAALEGRNFIPFPSRWKLIDRPSVAAPWALHEQEPFSKDVLAGLQRVLSKVSTEEEAVLVAAYLYRYWIPLGRSFLLKRSEDSSLAAQILVMNGEPLPAHIAERLAGQSKTAPALGKWDVPEAPLLFDRMAGKAGPGFMAALTQFCGEVNPETLASIKNIYSTTKHQTTKILAAGALVAHDGNEDARGFLNSTLRGWARSDRQERDGLYAAWAASTSKDPKLFPGLRTIVKEYLQQKDFVLISFPIADALIALSRQSSDADMAMLLQVLKREQARQEAVRNRKHSGAAEYLSMSIIREGSQKSRDLLKRFIKDDAYHRMEAISKLKRLPTYLIPLSSKGYAERLSP